jgi:DNA helicase-2/ATP-dependent DNA helicase PcrA
VDDEFIDDVKRDVRGAADALRRNALVPRPRKKTCGVCDYRDLCSSATTA